ncbi:glycosyltransferase [Leifsonia sp. F6_8S_P_1B]|uniref:Glycosyltransferase n=1 Tax=Leifsonia williamsii TaxID=3035919 RepID=A0ABT8KAQ7_9MICO|nr:glycosyltransferase [Leifsonia williamsii]MDN4614535.1 glycosyltransferase [Leifsonia williamsii]
MPSPAITVLVSARDAERTVGLAMRSVLSALPADGRMIVRSDGSTDGTLAAVRAVADPRVRVLADDRWLGTAASGNVLLDQVETPLVSRMDADDISLPGRFRAQLGRISAGIDFSFTTGVQWWEGTARVRPQFPHPVSTATAPLLLLLTNPFMHPTMVARTGAVHALGGYRTVASEDFDLYLRAAAAGYQLERLRIPRLVYRRYAAQTTAQPDWWEARSADSRVEEVFGVVAWQALGFVPRWFAWRRDGFPLGEAPAGVLEDIERFRDLALRLAPDERRPLIERLHRMELRARGIEARA